MLMTQKISLAFCAAVIAVAAILIPATKMVVVSGKEIANPVIVRFAWHETAQPNLINSAKLPALPFRTESW